MAEKTWAEKTWIDHSFSHPSSGDTDHQISTHCYVTPNTHTFACWTLLSIRFVNISIFPKFLLLCFSGSEKVCFQHQKYQ